jgi:protein-tyrosine phosphatase
LENNVINKVLFVCIGNICRSPMAEGLFKHALPEKAVFSAGLGAMLGDPADPLAVKLMAERGIDIREHRARDLAGWMISETDLIVTMDQDQKRYIEQRYPASRGKVVRIGEHANYDVPDPYRHGMPAFRHALNLISHGIDRLAEQLGAEVREDSAYLRKPLQETPVSLSPLA